MRKCLRAWKVVRERREYGERLNECFLSSVGREGGREGGEEDEAGRAWREAEAMWQLLVWRRWRRRARRGGEKKRVRGLEVERKREEGLMKGGWEGWKAAVAQQRLQQRLQEGGRGGGVLDRVTARIKGGRLGRLERAFVHWRLEVICQEEKEELLLRLNVLARRVVLRRAMQGWKEGGEWRRRVEKGVERMRRMRERRRGREVLWAWACLVKKERVLKQAQVALSRWVRRQRQRHVLKVWREAWRGREGEAVAAARLEKRLEWYEGVRERGRKRQALERWRRWVKARKRGSALVRRLVERKEEKEGREGGREGGMDGFIRASPMRRAAKVRREREERGREGGREECDVERGEARREKKAGEGGREGAREGVAEQREARREKRADEEMCAMQEGLIHVQGALLNARKGGREGGRGGQARKSKEQDGRRIEVLQEKAKSLQEELARKQQQLQQMERREEKEREGRRLKKALAVLQHSLSLEMEEGEEEEEEKSSHQRRSAGAVGVVAWGGREGGRGGGHVVGNHHQEEGEEFSSEREMVALDEELHRLRVMVEKAEEHRKEEGQEEVLRDVLRTAHERAEKKMQEEEQQQQQQQQQGWAAAASRSSSGYTELPRVSLPLSSQRRQQAWVGISSVADALPHSSLLMEEEEGGEEEEGEGGREGGGRNKSCIEEEEDADLEALEHMRGEIALLEHRIKFRFQQESGGGEMCTP